RRTLIAPRLNRSMCDLLDDVAQHPPGRSLALFRPARLTKVTVEHHDGWTERQQRAIAASARQPDMYGREQQPLRPPRFHLKYHYRCSRLTCRGHVQGLLDWECVALQHRCAHLSDDDLEQTL